MSVNKRRTVCFVVSDFIDDQFEQALSQANRRHDVVAVLLTDPRELKVPKVGLVTLEDAETGAAQTIDTAAGDFADRYAEQANARIEHLRSRLRRNRIDLIHVDISKPVADPLIEFFKARERRLRR